MAAELKDKQRKFCEEYIIDFNGTQAAIRAGYSKKTAKEQGARLLTNVNLQHYLTELKQKTAEDSGITKKQLIDELAKIAFFDIRKIYNEDNSLLDIKSFDDDSASAVAGIEVDEIFEQRQLSGYTKKVKLHNKIAAIERVSKMLGYDAPARQEITGKDGKPFNFIMEPASGCEQIKDEPD